MDITVVKTDGTKEVKNVRLDGNSTSAAYWGLIETVTALNKVLGYEEKFWERPDFQSNERTKRKK